MKKLILLSIAVIALSSCGRDYMVRSVETNRIIYMDGSQIGQDNKIGDTIRTEQTWRTPLAGDKDTIMNYKFTGVVISVDSKD